TKVIPYLNGTPTVISQLAQASLGQSTISDFLYYLVQLATTLILFAGANTCFSAFPNMVKIFADDGFMPKRLTARGHKLAFSNGIIFLCFTAISLVLLTRGSITALAAIYALCVFIGFTITGYGMYKHSIQEKPSSWRKLRIVHGASGGAAAIVALIITTVRFTDGTWLIVVGTPLVIAFTLKFNHQYTKENAALEVKIAEGKISNITRHDVTVLVASVDLATMAAVRYARTLRSRKLVAVHFVLDDLKAASILEEWSNHSSLNDISLQLIDCEDRRLANSVLDYALRATQSSDVELTLLLPNRIFSRFTGRLLHDQTAENIASAISQLDRVVATIVPFDVQKILDGNPNFVSNGNIEVEKFEVLDPKPLSTPISFDPISHSSKDSVKIGSITWRKRAQVVGRVTAIRVAPQNSAPILEVEIWDETGGVTLQFLGRRELMGLNVGATLQAEGMVGDEDGALKILNPSYQIIL
ncbi:MAG: amino acid permease, partial [Candidatus Nanopelagicaceae bacterium]|nr:amino acid permease [Candidatus Nanopelagicaceae bacterium]